MEGDTILGCAACRYSFDAPHHVSYTQHGQEAVEAYKKRLAEQAAKQPARDETIAEEAARIVYGDREKAYDDPNVNFEKIALMWNGLLLRKLKPHVRITPQDVALAFVLLKVSRESHRPQRDNRVDMIGYVLCGDRIVEAQDKLDRGDDAAC
jgi:hypothetical protein